MTTKLYANLGKGATDGTVATNALLSAGGDNPLIIGGASGWVFSAADISPDGPADGHGFRRATTGSSSYTRSAFEPTGNRSGSAAWFYFPATQTGDWNYMRAVNASEQAVIQMFRRSTGSVWLAVGSTPVTASQSPVLPEGWYRTELIGTYGDAGTHRAEYRVIRADGTVAHTWDSEVGGVTLGSAVAGCRYGEPSSTTHGVNPVRIGSRVVWGSLDSGWYPRTVTPFTDAPTPPPEASPVSHYNTAEGLTLGSALSGGVGTGTDGHKFSSRQGTPGTTIEVTDQAIFGTRAYVVKGSTGQAYAQWGIQSRFTAIRAHFKLAGPPSATTRFMIIRNELEEPIANLFITSGSQVMLQAGNEPVLSQTLAGVVDFARPIRLELLADVVANEVKAAWGYADEANGPVVTLAPDLEGLELTLVQFGKLLSTAWADDFIMDELAANIRATGFIGGYASSYTLLSTVSADLTDIEPGRTFELSAISGSGTWTQQVGPGHPTVDLELSGLTATGVAPYTREGVNLAFDYGGAIQHVGVMRATDGIVLANGQEAPLRIEIV